jgi:hypothetical protein
MIYLRRVYDIFFTRLAKRVDTPTHFTKPNICIKEKKINNKKTQQTATSTGGEWIRGTNRCVSGRKRSEGQQWGVGRSKRRVDRCVGG